MIGSCGDGGDQMIEWDVSRTKALAMTEVSRRPFEGSGTNLFVFK